MINKVVYAVTKLPPKLKRLREHKGKNELM